jgi:hypothetical protein
MNLLKIEDDEKFKNVNVLGYDFKIKYITPYDQYQITQRRAELQQRKPVESFTEQEFYFFENVAMVDLCTEETPPDFPDNESCLKWQSLELINKLAEEIRKHTNDLEAKLKKNKPLKGGTEE